MYKTNIYKLTEEFKRIFSSNSRLQTHLIENYNWSQLNISLDVIEDTDLAITSFANENFPHDDGLKYLWIYGLFQALFIQQDATKHLAETLYGEKGVYEKRLNPIKYIKEIRNKAVGHPSEHEIKGSKKSNPKKFTYHRIGRITINQQSFTLVSFDNSATAPDNNRIEFEEIQIDKLLTDQLTIIEESLKEFINKIQKILDELKSKYKGTYLMELIPKILRNSIIDIMTGTEKFSIEYKCGQLKFIKETYNKVLEAVNERGEPDIGSELDIIFHCIKRIEQFMQKDVEIPLTKMDVNIFTNYLLITHDKVVEIVEELDDYYN